MHLSGRPALRICWDMLFQGPPCARVNCQISLAQSRPPTRDPQVDPGRDQVGLKARKHTRAGARQRPPPFRACVGSRRACYTPLPRRGPCEQHNACVFCAILPKPGGWLAGAAGAGAMHGVPVLQGAALCCHPHYRGLNLPLSVAPTPLLQRSNTQQHCDIAARKRPGRPLTSRWCLPSPPPPPSPPAPLPPRPGSGCTWASS